ncbi:MAG: glycosyltransferase [Candidatus Nanosalina sp.]
MLSVVIPTLDEEEYLGRLLESIEMQSYQDYEVIVSDSGSDDDTREIAESYGAEVIETEKNGPGHGRNIGAEKAEGEKIVFLDADVKLVDKKVFDRIVETLEQEEVVAGSSSWRPIDGGRKERLAMWTGCVLMELKDKIPFKSSPEGTGNLLFIEKDIFQEIGGFDTGLPFYEDIDLLEKASEEGDLKNLRRQVEVSTRRMENRGIIRTGLEYIIPEIYFNLGKEEKMKEKFKFSSAS